VGKAGLRGNNADGDITQQDNYKKHTEDDEQRDSSVFCHLVC